MGDQAGDGRAAGMVGTQNLAQEDPQRDQRRIDPVEPSTRRSLSVLARRYSSERTLLNGKRSVLKKLTPQKTHLLLKPSVVRISHPEASLPVMDVLPNTIYAREAFLPMSLPRTRLAEN